MNLNLKTNAYEHMKELIANHQLEYDVIYSERKISTEIGVSRTPFHSALIQLEQEGYIDILPSRGFTLHKMTSKDILETFDVRSAIEYYSSYSLAKAHIAGKKNAKQTLACLEEALRSMKEVCEADHDIDKFLKYDFTFHQEIINFMDNRTFTETYACHVHRMNNLAYQSLLVEGRMKETIREHQDIFDAIKRGDIEHLFDITMTHYQASCRGELSITQNIDSPD